jgi:hypothetical protein
MMRLGFAPGSAVGDSVGIFGFLGGRVSLCGNWLCWRGIGRSAQSGATKRYGGPLSDDRAQRLQIFEEIVVLGGILFMLAIVE